MKRNIVILITIFIGVFVAFVASELRQDITIDTTPMPSVSLSPNPTITEEPTVSPDSSVEVVPIPPAEAEATCQMDGQITFHSQSVFESTSNTYLWYQNVDHSARRIFWETSPNYEGDISIGPNLFSGLEIPTGETSITVGFNDSYESSNKEYILSARIAYGVLINGAVQMRETQCAGTILLKIAF